MEFIVKIVGKIFEYTVAPVGYLFRYTSNVDNLTTQVQQLKNKKESLQHRIDEARGNGEGIEACVQDWMNNANRMFEEAETFLKQESHAKARCSCESFPRLVSRHQLSRKAKKMTDLIAIVEDPDKFTTISYRPCIESSIKLFKGYEAFETRKKALKEVMEALRNPNNNVRMIGIYGMPGIGKTMLAEEVMRQADNEKLFSKMVMISISLTPNIKRIQKEIAYKLDLNLDQVQIINRRADLLRNRLKQEKKILLVLDNIWSKLELFEIGIHFEDVQSGCKILLTSRSKNVVCKDMGVQKSFKLDPLSSDEAENLFKKTVGATNEQPNFSGLVPVLVRECAGLPIAIVAVASALRNRSMSYWKDACLQLKFSHMWRMLDNVYSSIRWSYTFLGNEKAKSLLLLCSLHRENEDIKIEDLMRYSAGWVLFKDATTLEELRNRMYSLVNILESHCLLLVGDDGGTVKMHNIIRHVLISIAAEERCIYGLSGYPKLENAQISKGSKAISILEEDDVGQLPERLECPHLELLIMPNPSLGTIPRYFFKETKELKALVLHTQELLPSSLQLLQNLRSLCLRYSKLEDVGLVGELKNLNILDLSKTTILHLPKQIGQLDHLQLLDLRGCDNLQVIQPNVLSSLVRLEELYMPETFEGWEVEGSKTERRNASLIEMKNLQHLTTLYLCVPDIKMFPNESFFGEKLQRYQIHVRGQKYSKEISSLLALRDCERSQLQPRGLEALMRRSKRLLLDRILGVKNNVVYELGIEGFPQLKCLEVLNCEGVEYIVNFMDQTSIIHPRTLVFQGLETLHLGSLADLKKICHGHSFNKLREVSVKNCGQLKNLFPLSIAKRLHEVKVENCEMMEEIVAFDQREYEVAFDELRSLHLQSLPKFVQLIRLPQLGVISSSVESPNYPLFGIQVALPKLEKLKLYEMDVKNLWPDQFPPASNYDMQNLSQLEVCRCNNLKHLSSFAVAKSLVKLQKLEVSECSSLEEVFIVNKKQGGDNQDGRSLLEMLSFPQLHTLHLNNLPSLKTFCAALVDAEEPLFNDMMTVMFASIETLVLQGMIVTKLWEDRLSVPICMWKLKELIVRECKNLKYLLSSTVCGSLVQLERLTIESCEEMEEVVAIREESGSTAISANVLELFPNLQSLQLQYLPKLKKFCGGDYVEFPLLSRLTILGCPELSLLIQRPC